MCAKVIFFRWVIILIGLSLFSCLDQELDSLTAGQAQRLLAGPFGTKTWQIEGENSEITFSVLTIEPSAILKQIDGDTSFINLDFRLSQSLVGTFTDTLFFDTIDSNAILGEINLLETITSTEIQLFTDKGIRLKLINK